MRQSILESAPVRLACRSPTGKTCPSRANTMGGLTFVPVGRVKSLSRPLLVFGK